MIIKDEQFCRMSDNISNIVRKNAWAGSIDETGRKRGPLILPSSRIPATCSTKCSKREKKMHQFASCIM